MKEQKKIRTKDGRTVYATCYCPAASNGKVMIVAAAAGIVQKDYNAFAVYFCQLGYPVITFDYRGIGESAPPDLRGFETGLQQWAVQDTDAVIRFARSLFLNQELIYIGHGIGGELIGLAQASQYINRLVLVSSSLSCYKLWTWRGRLKITLLKAVLRVSNKWIGYSPGKHLGFFRDLPKGVAHEWANWCNNPNGLFDVFPENNYRKLQVPLLAVSFLNDWMTPPGAVQGLLDYFSSASITWHQLDPQNQGLKRKHYCFFESGLKSIAWVLLENWLSEDSNNLPKEKIKTRS